MQRRNVQSPGRAHMVVLGLLAMTVSMLPSSSSADHLDVLDCTGPTTDSAPGSVEWELRDQNNRYCAMESLLDVASNPAFAIATARAQESRRGYSVDPFREPTSRWNGIRGRYREVTFTDRNGTSRPGSIYMPLESCIHDRCIEPPYPGVVIVCHVCYISASGSPDGTGNAWAAQSLAEAGYIVFVPNVGGNNVSITRDAIDYFFSTPDEPSPRSEVNPDWEWFDRRPIGIAGWSGAGGVSLSAGQQDPRVGAIVTWDRASSGPGGLELTKPSMFQTADYHSSTPAPGATIYEPRRTPPATRARHHDFDALKAAGVDTMHVALRGTTHWEWGGRHAIPRSRHGERIGAYYTLAWFDRYIIGADDPAMADDARRRLLATTYDGSADVYSIGTGIFDPYKASATNIEAGNVPITIEGLSVPNMLSFWYTSRYFLDGGQLDCADMKAGCS